MCIRDREYTPITELETGFTVNLNPDSIIEYCRIYLLCHVTQVHIIFLQQCSAVIIMICHFSFGVTGTPISVASVYIKFDAEAFKTFICFSVPDRGPQYCDEHVCLSVCPHLHLRHTNFLGTLLGPRLATLQCVMYFRFVDDIFQVMGPMTVWLYRSRVVAMSCIGCIGIVLVASCCRRRLVGHQDLTSPLCKGAWGGVCNAPLS